MKRIGILIVLLISIQVSESFAADSGASPAPVSKRKKQTLNFEDELVEGSTPKPELFYLFQRKNFNYKRLFKLRENFIPEAQRTAEELRPRRGSP